MPAIAASSAPVIQKRSAEPSGQRLLALDAYRGAIMIFMASGGFGFSQVAEKFPESGVWRFLDYHTSHVTWIGGGAWDMIQPAFMFMVGVALPFSLASRSQQGKSVGRQFAHAAWRALVLIALGIFIQSRNATQTNFLFTNVLTQIGLGYLFLFLLARCSRRIQIGALVTILVATWIAFTVHPAPPADPNLRSAGIRPAEAQEVILPEPFQHWSKGLNAFADFDRWFMNLFPRERPWIAHSGGYQTLNFVPSLATMLLGLLCGQILRRESNHRDILLRLFGWAGACLALGIIAGLTICPIVKRIWTPSWVLYSGGIVIALLATFYWLVEMKQWRRWTFPLVVVGTNSIAIYLLFELLAPWIANTLKVHLGSGIFSGTYGPVIQRCSVLVVLWLVCWWLYRRRIFLKI